MARIVADRVLETSTTTGTGSYTLDGAVLGYRAASAVCANGDTITYYAEATNDNGVANGDWEIGIGTWGTGGTLARTTIYSSSNANAAVSWTAGTRRIGLSLVSAASLGNTTITGTVDVSGQTTLDTALSGVAKLTAGVVSTATPGTDFASAAQGVNADSIRVDQDVYGFLNQTETTLSFVDATSTFILAPVGASFSYYRTGIKYTITGSVSIVLPAATATTTLYFIFIDANAGILSYSVTPWTLQDTKVPVAIVTRNSTLSPTYFIGEERHSCKWLRRDHLYQHVTTGTLYASGGALTGPTVANSVNANKTCAVASANFFDEDIYEATTAIVRGNGSTDTFYTSVYRTGVSTWVWLRGLMPFKYTGAGAIEYDNNGVMTAAGAGGGGATRYVNYYLAITNVLGQESYVWIPGRAAFTTAALAYAESFSSFTMVGFPCPEIVAFWQFTWDTNGTGLGLCRLNRTPVRINSNIITSTAVTSGSHNGLSGINGGTAGEYYHATLAEYTGTGTGNFVRETSPTLATPNIGVATATTVNKVTVTAPATGSTLTIVDGATLTASATASVSGTNTGDNAVNTLYSGLVTNATHTGDVTGSDALTIASGAVTYAKIQNVSATSRVLGRITAAAGVVEELTGANLATIIGITNTAANVTSVNGATGAVTLTNLGLQNFTSGATVSGSNTGDNAVNTLYSGLVTNATHTGDVTGSGALTLASIIVAGGPTGSTSVVPVITWDAKGRLTAVTTATITPASIGAQASGTYVTSVGVTAPVASTGGTAPTISMAAATATVNGYMTSTYASKLDGIAAGATNVTNTNQLTNGAGYITSAGTAANATTVGGLAVHAGTNNEVNKIVRTNASGYCDFGWINTISGVCTGTPTRVYCSEDAYIRYYSMATFTTYVQAAATGSWGISVTGSSASTTGNAATVTSATGRTDGTAYPVVWNTTGGTSQNYSCTAVNIQSSTGTLNATNFTATGSVSAATKSFLIPHPTKIGMKLRYGSLEGPENGVYIRGRLSGDTIELPEYWTKLVDANSITVSLTSIGKHQDLFVKEIADNKIIVGNQNLFGNKIDCFYVVYGERVDVDKLVVEF